MKKLVSIIIPVYNEEENIVNCISRVDAVLKPYLGQYNFEVIFTDNCSEDNTFSLIKKMASQYDHIRGYRFTRNYGFQNSILAGLKLCKGDAVIQLDCDLQDPPEIIPAMIKKWEKGYKVVYGIRVKRKENYFLSFCRKLYYRAVNYLSEEDVPLDAGDFRLIDRVVINEVINYEHQDMYIRGFLSKIGYPSIGIEYQRDKREAGKSKFKFSKLTSFAINGIISSSIKPLYISLFVALGFFAIFVLGMLSYFVGSVFFQQNWPRGFTTLAILILLGSLLNSFFFGILGLYIGAIFKQVKASPVYIIQDCTESNLIFGSEEEKYCNGKKTFSEELCSID